MGDLHSLKVSPPKYLIITSGKTVSLWWAVFAATILARVHTTISVVTVNNLLGCKKKDASVVPLQIIHSLRFIVRKHQMKLN